MVPVSHLQQHPYKKHQPSVGCICLFLRQPAGPTDQKPSCQPPCWPSSAFVILCLLTRTCRCMLATSFAGHVVPATSLAGHVVSATSLACHVVPATSLGGHIVPATSLAGPLLTCHLVPIITCLPLILPPALLAIIPPAANFVNRPAVMRLHHEFMLTSCVVYTAIVQTC
eukprot:1159177-Pelagomonas_calceolata.AAC.3